ncbi:unnamed protein product [Heligmosomoides polygyrus]|uniref:Uncharacterized protein n=1 Tax=Heligmosomoides polygyrus TaxID=6339 RepID=A0A3P8EDT6_HELPZ|nr:unnamed protein product [Heligmosomoides polygyrus]
MVVSKDARLQLYEFAQQFIPVYANEGIMPLKVLNLRTKDREWLRDRAMDFTNCAKDPLSAKRKMDLPLAAVDLAAARLGPPAGRIITKPMQRQALPSYVPLPPMTFFINSTPLHSGRPASNDNGS